MTDLPSLAAALRDRYTLERELGHGGMATVYLVQDLKHGRPVALKVLHPQLALLLGPQRFQREIRLAARLQHPHICSVYDSGDSAGHLWFTMPYVRGESLRQRLRREGSLPVEEALRITRETAQALHHAHRDGVVHRDIKPENLLLTEDGMTLVADFGIARVLDETQAEHLTDTGMALGTPAYMAPEQALGAKTIDARADQYALAVTCWEMLAGRAPFVGPTPVAIATDRLRSPLPSASAVRPEIPAPVDLALRRAMALEPDDRFPSVAEFARALGSTTMPSPERRPGVRGIRGPTAVWSVVAGVTAAITLIAFLVFPRPAPVSDAQAASRVVVLPFVNLGRDTADAYFADGMADELSTALSKVPGVRVASRSLASRYRGQSVPPGDVARALNVGSVLEGTVRRAGGRLRVTAQLTDGSSGLVLWGERYDGAVQDIFAVQDEITSAIVTALRGRLAPASGGTSSGAAPRGTGDLAAYDLYLKGRFAWSKRGERGLREAVKDFNDAIDRDAGFARAHAGLAMAYVVLPFFASSFPADSGLSLAERSASRALMLDSTLGDAHLALAYTLKMRWRFHEAEPHFRNAIALGPDDPVARHWYGVYLYAVGRATESVGQLRVARELDPFGSTIATDGSTALYAARQYEAALVEARRAYALDTSKSDTRLILGMIHLALGHPDSAVRGLEDARRLGIGLDVRGYLSAAQRAAGRVHEADAAYEALRRDERSGQAQPYDLAIAAAAAGDRSAALDALERTVEHRHMFVTELTLPCDPRFDPIRETARFHQLLARAGMQSCAVAP